MEEDAAQHFFGLHPKRFENGQVRQAVQMLHTVLCLRNDFIIVVVKLKLVGTA